MKGIKLNLKDKMSLQGNKLTGMFYILFKRKNILAVAGIDNQIHQIHHIKLD